MRGNLNEFAQAIRVSEPTLRKWIAAEPDQLWIIKRGSNGDAYEIDFPGATAAWQAAEEAKTQAARRRAEELQQYGLELGLGTADQPAVGLSIAERKQLLEEELVAMKIAKERGELVSFASVSAALGDVLVKIRQRQATFSARLAKKIDLTRDQIVAIDRLSASDQNEVAAMMELMGADVGASADDPAPALEHTAL